jgi:hypothetical protein
MLSVTANSLEEIWLSSSLLPSFHFVMSLLVNDPDLTTVYDDVRDDKTETNWAFFGLASGKPDRLQVSGKGSGGLAEFVQQLQADTAGWGYVRMNMSNDE